MKRIKKSVITLVLIMLSGSACRNESVDINENKVMDSASVTPAPAVAMPTVRVDGISYHVVACDAEPMLTEESYLGDVISTISPDQLPVQDFESNCLPVGTMVYRDAEEEESLVLKIYNEISKTYYYKRGNPWY